MGLFVDFKVRLFFDVSCLSILAVLSKPLWDSRTPKETLANAERYLLLCEPRKEIRLERLSRKCGEAIKDLSRKAKSLFLDLTHDTIF